MANETILILDDEEDIVETLQDILKESGYKVLSAMNGLEGLNVIRHQSPDLILLDMNMPKMGGLAFFQMILDAKSLKPKFPVLVLSARNKLESVFKDYEVDFVSKPFQIDDLLIKIESALLKSNPGNNSLAQEACITNQLPLAYIVDNDHIFASHVKNYLAQKFSSLCIPSAEQAIKQAALRLPSIIVMRLEMRDTPGDAAALKLKMIPKVSDIPILIYSTENNTDAHFEMSGRIYEKLDVRIIAGTLDAEAVAAEAEHLYQCTIKKAA